MKSCVGEVKALIPHLTGLDDDLLPWTAGFWQGLRLSGALVVHGGHPRLQPGRPWLAEDLERLPFPGRLSTPDRQGRQWLIRCQAWRLPVANALSADVLAGLLAGARRETTADGIWLVVPHTESVLRLLSWWGVSMKKAVKENELWVSPFYGVLLSGHMPVVCAQSMLVRRAGGCPLLPLAIWESTFGSGGPPSYLLPERAGALPFACGDATRKRHGWTRDFLHATAVHLGVAQASPEMRRLLKEWRASAAAVDQRALAGLRGRHSSDGPGTHRVFQLAGKAGGRTIHAKDWGAHHKKRIHRSQRCMMRYTASRATREIEVVPGKAV